MEPKAASSPRNFAAGTITPPINIRDYILASSPGFRQCTGFSCQDGFLDIATNIYVIYHDYRNIYTSGAGDQVMRGKNSRQWGINVLHDTANNATADGNPFFCYGNCPSDGSRLNETWRCVANPGKSCWAEPADYGVFALPESFSGLPVLSESQVVPIPGLGGFVPSGALISPGQQNWVTSDLYYFHPRTFQTSYSGKLVQKNYVYLLSSVNIAGVGNVQDVLVIDNLTLDSRILPSSPVGGYRLERDYYKKNWGRIKAEAYINDSCVYSLCNPSGSCKSACGAYHPRKEGEIYFNSSAGGDYHVAPVAAQFLGILAQLPRNAGGTPEQVLRPYFDENYYLAQNGDVADGVRRGAISSGFVHYLYCGGREGRNPNSWFSESAYINHPPNWDVRNAINNRGACGSPTTSLVSGFEHYLRYGAREGRVPTPGFNEAYYLGANDDVFLGVRANIGLWSGFHHYMLYGRYEGRRPAP